MRIYVYTCLATVKSASKACHEGDLVTWMKSVNALLAPRILWLASSICEIIPWLKYSPP